MTKTMATAVVLGLLASLAACGGSDEPAAAPVTETVTVTEPPPPAETVTETPAVPTSDDLQPLCTEFRGLVLGVRPGQAIDNAIELEDAVRAELDPGSGQYFGMMSVVGALYSLGLADQGLSSVAKAQDHILDVGAPILTVCDAG